MAPGARLRPPRNRRFSIFNHQVPSGRCRPPASSPAAAARRASYPAPGLEPPGPAGHPPRAPTWSATRTSGPHTASTGAARAAAALVPGRRPLPHLGPRGRLRARRQPARRGGVGDRRAPRLPPHARRLARHDRSISAEGRGDVPRRAIPQLGARRLRDARHPLAALDARRDRRLRRNPTRALHHHPRRHLPRPRPRRPQQRLPRRHVVAARAAVQRRLRPRDAPPLDGLLDPPAARLGAALVAAPRVAQGCAPSPPPPSGDEILPPRDPRSLTPHSSLLLRCARPRSA